MGRYSREDDLKEFKVIDDTVGGANIRIEREEAGTINVTKPGYGSANYCRERVLVYLVCTSSRNRIAFQVVNYES